MTAVAGGLPRHRLRGGDPCRRQDRDFARLFLRCHASPAYRLFCRRVYGVDLCQTNVLDRPQLDLLEAALGLRPGERVLDLGSGLGTLAEHLSDRTGARVTGIDRCAPAVRAARRRTAAKGDRLTFRWGDLRELSAGRGSEDGPWDALLAVDVLYFLDDLDPVVAAFPGLLAAGGRGVVFASEVLPEGGRRPPEAEIPAHTRVGRALARHGFPFAATDVTDREVEVWRRYREVGDELRGAFEAEGAVDLLEGRVAEAERTLEWADAGRLRRYMYRFTPSP
ncbi:MAG TPA: methyltransferase domain-containing protein [Thermoanaerobaculia bacterium]|nr:methyltransferase domain-containing protein [Thermoanaerobaculia bacterium]